jgi:antitoxin ParD1/3/4
LHHNCITSFEGKNMTRASISITPPNDAWIRSQIDSEEFSSRSEVINDLIRKARKAQDEIELIRAELIAGEKGGTSARTPNDIINAVLDKRRKNGTL